MGLLVKWTHTLNAEIFISDNAANWLLPVLRILWNQDPLTVEVVILRVGRKYLGTEAKLEIQEPFNNFTYIILNLYGSEIQSALP